MHLFQIEMHQRLRREAIAREHERRAKWRLHNGPRTRKQRHVQPPRHTDTL